MLIAGSLTVPSTTAVARSFSCYLSCLCSDYWFGCADWKGGGGASWAQLSNLARLVSTKPKYDETDLLCFDGPGRSYNCVCRDRLLTATEGESLHGAGE